MKDYYKGMEGHIPDEAKAEHARLALIELPVMDEHGNPKLTESPGKACLRTNTPIYPERLNIDM